MLKWVFTLIFFLNLPVGASTATALKGSADVSLTYKKRVYRFQQVIIIDKEGTALFEAVDDFGTVLFRLNFTESGEMFLENGDKNYAISEYRFKKLLSLSITRDELVAFLLHRVPEGDEFHAEWGRSSQGEEFFLVRKEAKRKKDSYTVTYSRPKKWGGKSFPEGLEIVSTKASLKLTWQHLEVE